MLESGLTDLDYFFFMMESLVPLLLVLESVFGLWLREVADLDYFDYRAKSIYETNVLALDTNLLLIHW